MRLVCSCDRHNYGDLLFPIVTQWSLFATPGFRERYACETYGMRRSDLSAYGALPSRSMRDLYRDARAGDVVLLAGGENLAQTWFVMHLTLLGPAAAGALVFGRKMFGQDFAEGFSRWRFGGRQPFPYILSPNDFDAGVRVMYNSMGGWPLRAYAPTARTSIVSGLVKASFLSVREKESASILRELGLAAPVHVAPDCIFLLSDMLPKDALADKASAEVKELVRESGDYVCFQCHPRYGEENRKELARELLSLASQTGLNILLTPIGRIYSFEDDIFLHSLSGDLGNRARMLPSPAGIYDIAHALASARMFCGTSLHGVITALTYEIPFVPLRSADPKLANNIDSWGLGELFPRSPANEIACHGVRSLAVDRVSLAEHAAALKNLARANMRRLAENVLAYEGGSRTSSVVRSKTAG